MCGRLASKEAVVGRPAALGVVGNASKAGGCDPRGGGERLWRGTWYGGRGAGENGPIRRTDTSSGPVRTIGTRRREQARSVLRQAGAPGSEEAVPALSPQVHAARWLHEPDLSPVPENREGRLRFSAFGQTPVPAARDTIAERGKARPLLPPVRGTCARRAGNTHGTRRHGAG